MTARAILVSAASSAAGKTTVTAGLLRAFRRRGLRARAAKAGPDYIDPAFHKAASGLASVNLDSFAMPPVLLDALVADAVGDCELLVVEGAMGLFDGLPGGGHRRGAAADLAARYALPVLLVVDATGQSQTAAALVRGLGTHDPAVRIGGVILNRVGSDRHRTYVADAIAATGVPVFGALPREAELTLPSRHLGLVQAGEHGALDGFLDRLAERLEREVDIDRLLAAFATPAIPAIPARPALPPPGRRIALAADVAFTFVYEHVLGDWRRAGAEIAMFSPLADEPPPEDCDSCWLPGGYPELHAGRLAAAQRFKAGLRRFSETRPVHGECGGYMVLGRGLVDAAGTRHEMTGLLSHTTSFAARKMTLGYRVARLLGASPLGPRGATVRGHEFHYSTMTESGQDAPLADLSDGQGNPLGLAGGQRGHVSGSYFHAIAPEPASGDRLPRSA